MKTCGNICAKMPKNPKSKARMKKELLTNLVDSICCEVIFQLVHEQGSHYDKANDRNYKSIMQNSVKIPEIKAQSKEAKT